MLGSRLATEATVASNRSLLRMLGAYLLICLAEFSSWMVIILVAFDRGGAVMVGVASASMLLPAIVIMPFAAAFGDRLPRGRALSIAQAAVGLLTLALALLLALGAPLWLLLLGGAAQTLALSLVGPMHHAALPFVALHPGELVAANGLSALIEGVSIFIGFTAAGALIGAFEPYQVMLGCALVALAASLMTSGLGISATRQHLVGSGPGALAAAVRGLTSLRGNWGALALLGMLGCTFIVDGSTEPLMLTYNAEVLGLGDGTAGFLAGAYGAGLAVGAGFQAGLPRRRTASLALWGSALLAAAFGAVGLANNLLPAFLLAGIAGAGASVVIVASRTLLQRSTDNVVLARVFAVQEGVQLAGLSIGALLGPIAIQTLGPRLAFIPLGLTVLAVAGLARRRLLALDRSAQVREREIRLLTRVPFMAALSLPALDHLAQSASWMSAAPGTAVVRQGEAGDAFYLVESGELSVTVDGTLRDHRLGPGEAFGEIALMFRARRSATITAIAPCELLRIDAAQFLAAITASPDGAELAQAVAQEQLARDRRG